MRFLSGMRVGALGALPLEALEVAARTVRQWPSLGVKTKNSKSATMHLQPIPELLAVVADWDAFVRGWRLPTAMWAKPIKSRWGEVELLDGATGKNWSIALNKRLRALFALAGLPPLSPHKFRRGHAVWALQHARTMADYKAISQNLMHGDIRVTDGIYAPLLGSENGLRATVFCNL